MSHSDHYFTTEDSAKERAPAVFQAEETDKWENRNEVVPTSQVSFFSFVFYPERTLRNSAERSTDITNQQNAQKLGMQQQ